MDNTQDTNEADNLSDGPNLQSKGLDSRAYQIEMFEQAMRENTIVAMETGSGKTQIAKLRIEAELERSPQKLIWFCAPSVVLAQQQHSFLSSQLPAIQARLITGLDNVQFWSTQDVWDTVLHQIDLVISTPQVLLDALSHAFVTLQRISLLVFDEAHHCMAGGPMARIMQLFYHPAKKNSTFGNIPHVLGLTASPITNKPSMLSELEINMDSVCRTPTLQVQDYRKYVHLPILEKIEFPPSQSGPSPIVEALDKTVVQLSLHGDPTVAWLQSIKQRSVALEQKLTKILSSGRTPTMKQMGSFLNHATHINDNIGSWSADIYIRKCAQRLRDSVALHEDLVPQLTDHEQKYVDLKLQVVVNSVHKLENQIPEGRLIAPKAQVLIDYLLQQYRPGITVIVFVKRRSVAFALTRLFEDCPQMKNYKPFSFVGANNPAHQSLVDLADTQIQNEAFADFHAGKRNICIATQVMEEGVDIQATNLVIRFDEPENFRSFIQSRGRARRPDSKFVVMHESKDWNTLVKVQRWKELEDVMKEQYSDLARHLLVQEARELEFEKGDEVYQVQSTGALLNYDNAQQHLEHFCATLPWESTSEPARPTILVSGAIDCKTARVVLPASVPPSLQTTNSLHIWRTERMAKKDAAFQTYKSLHTAKLVNDNLLPYPRARKVNDKLEGRDSFYDVQEALDPWKVLLEMADKSAGLQRHRIRITGNDFALRDMVLLLSIKLDDHLSFKLYDTLSGPIQVDITPMDDVFNADLVLASRITLYLFDIVLGRRLKQMKSDDRAPYFLIPDIEDSELSAWFERVQTLTPLCDVSFNSSLERQVYLIKHDKEEILYKWRPSLKPGDVQKFDQDSSITAERLSKQLSYITHDETAAARDLRSLTAQSCHISGLSATYGTFMLFMPSISFMLAVTIRAQIAVQNGALASVGFTNSTLVQMALTSSSAHPDRNYETLEFLGDSLLKYYATIHVYFNYPELTEGGLTSKYSAIASNGRLQKATRALGLDAGISVDRFSGAKWTLAIKKNEKKSRTISSKTLADIIEALISAAYLDPKNGPTKDEMPLSALKCLLPNIQWRLPSFHMEEYHRQNNLSPVNIARLEPIETLLDYNFTHKPLLVEALTRFSGRPGTQSYQRLEFLGDGILDRIVNMTLYDSPFGHDPEHLKYRRDALVNRWILVYIAMQASHTMLVNNVTTTSTGTTTISQSPKITRLVDYMRTSSDHLELRQRTRAETTFLAVQPEINTALSTGSTFPWTQLHSIDASKSYSDIIESLAAAVYIDSRGNLATVEHVLDKLGLMPLVRRMATDPTFEVRQPVVMLTETSGVRVKTKQSGRVSDDSLTWTCVVSRKGVVLAESSSGVSEKHAEAVAAGIALEKLAMRKERGKAKGIRKRSSDEMNVGSSTDE